MSCKKLLLFILVVHIDCISTVVLHNETFEEGRKKKDKYLLPVILGGFIIKAVIFPLAFKVMAVMTSVSVLLSLMSLILSSIVGYVKVALKHQSPVVKVIHLNDQWTKDDYRDLEEYPYYHSDTLID
ncbi:uncharacterized protein LOC126265642 [Aethina tumida]|uniref:uncharacterized protein LOC126265642 n=1 Tax=Aethina tumida TaxID=116153 RepID=UPI002149120B|nr:uncharacterized protein LOC126265642 [Aethina tumida]